MPEVNIRGFAELDKALHELSLVAQRSVLTKAVRAGADPIVDQAAANAPRETGALAGAITTQLMTSQNSVDSVTIRIGPTKKAFYGSYHDRGTKFIKATHWLMRAFEQRVQAAKDRIFETLKVQIFKAAQKK